MYQVHNQPNKTQYLNLIDKCTQILRQDRIWLRNILKANNQDILYLFRGLPKNTDMKQLQIKLRKYIMRAKDKEKQQQLLRFKENMHLPDFIQVAAQKRHQPQQHNKSQNKLRGPLKQSQANEPKSSFVAKWNNYTHYNPSINLGENRSPITNQQTSSHNKSLNKQWSSNYKPHSFNKGLNGELFNKLSSKNNSLSRMNRHNKSSTSLTKEKNSIINSRFQNNEEVDEMNQSSKHPFAGGRSSSKSLKQLESKIYEELRQFQHNKAKKQAQMLSISYSQRSVQKNVDKQKQKPLQTFKESQSKPSTMSKQNIDELLKFKLGNCDFEVYRKSQETQHDQEPTEYVFKEKSASQKKLYHDGMFPPIEEQTQRDSESQRYPEEPLRFGMMNMNNSKHQVQDRHKVTFASFAKGSPNQSFKGYDLSDAKMINSTANNIHQFNYSENTQSYPTKSQHFTNGLTNHQCQQPMPQNKISQSLYASAQKKSDINENYIESDLHKSIMESIHKSRESFPEKGYSNLSKAVEGVDFGMKNVSNFNFMSDKSVQLPAPKAPSEISSFQSSLYSSTHDDQSLFTSPQLLNECRNFLRKTQQINFQNSGLKQITGSVFQSKFDSPLSSQQKSFRQTFNNLSSTGMINFPQPITITESITKDFYNNSSQARINSLFESKQSSASKGNNIEFQTYSKPGYIGGQDSFKKSEFMGSSMKKSDRKNEFFGPQSIKKEEVSFYNNHSRKASSMKKHSQIEETIALPVNPLTHFSMSNSSKYQNQAEIQTSEFPNIMIKTDSSRKETLKQEPIENLIDLEDVIDRILQANEGNIEVDSTWLKHAINNRCIFDEQIGTVLKGILAQFISSEATYNFIEIINCVQKSYRQNPSYEPRKSPSRDICSLLDIEEKGFITFDDVQNFVTQLQNAGVDHIDAIAQYLEEVFDISDFMGVKQISYINLYIIKNEDCFENLWKYLQEFEFEISADE